jgi:predicted transcriptional regulator
LVAQKYGLNVTEIELYLFGGASKIEEEPRTAKSEMIIAGVGPLSSLILGVLFLSILFLIPFELPAFMTVTFLYSGISNIGLGFFNLLPAFPIDGGRILRAFLWYRKKDILAATKTATRVGSFFAYGLIAYGLFQTFTFGILNGFWLILMGSFLNNQTRQSYVQLVNEINLENMVAKNLITMPKLHIPFDTTISDAIRNYFMVYKRKYFPVVQGETIVGMIDFDSIKRIPIYQRDEIIVGYVMYKTSVFPEINENKTGKDVLKKLRSIKGSPRLVTIKESNEILGLISEEDLIKSLRFCQINPNQC